MLVIHPHFHRRRTGVTAHTELIVGALAQRVETRALGGRVDPQLPHIAWREVLRRTRSEPTIWHAHRNNELLAGLLLRLLGRKVKLVFTRHGSNAPGWFTRLLVRQLDALVTLTEEGAQLMGVPSRIIGHGVQTERFRPPTQRAKAWSQLGLPGQFGLGVVGRIRPEKGQADFVAALAPLLERFPQWTPVLVGLAKRSETGFVRSLVEQCGGRLHCVGEQTDVRPWYQGLSVVVQPSHRESFGMVHLEAMASGCCLVAARLPHVPRLVEDRVTGFLFEPGSVADLQRVLEHLMANPEEAERVGARAAQAVRERFSVEREAAALLELYGGLLAR